MAYNHGREDRKWRIWKEAEEKLLRECGVDEATIEQIRMADRADFNSNRRFYRWTNDVAEYLEDMAGRERQAEVGTVETPHMHLCFVPITPDNKLSAKAILGNQKSLSEWQTAYHERMSSRWNQLERGQSSMETKRKHVPTWLYKLGGRLDKQYEEIVSALSDINAFNAGKKRDKALDLLSAWLPDVEKFSKEIGKQQAYIDSLKERIGQESDYAGRMRDEKYEQELKVQKANQKIFELQRTNEQMGRLLSKIPPEVLEELQKNHRSRAKER